MAWLSEIRSRILGLFRGGRMDRERDEEMRFHLEQAIRRNLERGMGAEEARRRARLDFGGTEHVKELCRDERGTRPFEDLLRDLGYGLKQMRRNPGYTAVAVLILALGIGATSALFALVNAVFLRMLPVRNPQELITIEVSRRAGTRGNSVFSYPFYMDLRDSNQALSGVLAHGGSTARPGDDPTSEPVSVGLVSGNYFAVLGLEPLVGRLLTETDDATAAGDSACMISYRLWQRQFGGDPSVVGRILRLNGRGFIVVGVVPRRFAGLNPGWPDDVFIPISKEIHLNPVDPNLKKRHASPTTSWLSLLGRLKPGISLEQARESLELTVDHMAKARELEKLWRGRVVLLPAGRGYEGLRRWIGSPLLVVAAAVAMVLLIACGNLANLLLARGSARKREVSMRLALGAGRARVVRQLLTENLLLAFVGGGAGLLVAASGPSFLLQFAPRRRPIQLEVAVDWQVLAFTFAVSLVAGLLFGLGPALNSSRLDLVSSLKESPALGSARLPVRKVLIVAQVALSLVLLMGAGLLIGSLHNLKTVFPGFDLQNLVVAQVAPDFSNDAQNQAFFEQLLARMRKLPGARSVSTADVVPLSGSGGGRSFFPEGGTAAGMTSSVRIGPDYFATMGIPLLAGRSFAQGDGTRENRLAIINQAAARSFWPGRNPVGSHILSGSGSDPRTDRNALEIVGVVGDTKYNALREDTQPILYEPVGQGSARTLTVLIRTGGNPRIMMAAVQAELRAAGAAVPASRITTLEAITADSLAIDRLLATLSGFFAFLALLLAALGLYGVMAYSVGRRSPEIGIRMALGARQADILWMIQRESLLLVAAGIAAGIPGGLAAGRLISSYLYGIGWSNPMSAACVAATLLAAGALAASLPAWRAARISPMVVLRSQ